MKISVEQYARGWYESLKSAKESEREKISQAFLRRLQKDGRLSWLKKISQAVYRLDAKAMGLMAITVTTSRPEEKNFIEEAAAKIVGTDKIRTTTRVDKNLIGGLLVETEDVRWDLSVKKILNNLEQQISS